MTTTPDQAAAHWNTTLPVGTPVRYWPIMGEPESMATRTRSKAWVLGGHTPVVMVDDVAGGVSLAHVRPEPDAFEEATGIRTVESDAIREDQVLMVSPGGLHESGHAPQGARLVDLGDGLVWDARHGVFGFDVAGPAVQP
ncbi:hypothetical protein [Nonomuraea sp. NPDC005650]|uniref:hypothetical protein n=1 Tax=Nonomuraea sp. NPDC005650 TaxID=3157045 RepID=UPI0033ACA9FE